MKCIILEDERNQIKKLINSFFSSPSENQEEFCNQAQELSKELPQRIRRVLQDFAKQGSNSGFLLFQGFDTEPVETPPDNKRKIGETTDLAKIQSILMNTLGQMIAYEAEGYGQLFQDIVPDKSMANNQSSIGSHTELEIHTEQAFSKLRPDFLSLACLRGDPNAQTYVLPLHAILDNLSQEDIELLKQPLWTTGVDLSFRLHGQEFVEGDIRGPMPVLNTDSKGEIGLVFDQDLMRGVNDIADDMLKKVVDIYYKDRIAHNLQPGEIIFIDNRRALHGRSPFFPNYDGKDRFLVRCFATLDYGRSEYARICDTRTVAAMYS